MTFDEYTAARRSAKWGIAVDAEDLTRFVSRQPETCPVCGTQTRDPFGMGVVIHDIERCAAKRPNADLCGARQRVRTSAGLGAEDAE